MDSLKEKEYEPFLLIGEATMSPDIFYSEPRSYGWEKVRNKKVASQPYCTLCRTKSGLQVHHILPFHLRPELELVENNLIVFCQPHHFLFGHLLDWKAYNSNVIEDIRVMLAKINTRLY